MLQAKISAAFFTANGGFSTEGGMIRKQEDRGDGSSGILFGYLITRR
ncbi:hypothetical protein [Neobacillus niacini]